MIQKQIKLKDFLNYKFLSNVQMSPDKQSCTFTVVTCDEADNAYNSNVYVWRNGKCMQLTRSNKDSNVCYLDAETILFKSSRDTTDQERIKNGEELTSYYKISLNGGEAEKYFEIPLNVSSIEQLSENEFLVMASYDRDFSIMGRENRKEELLKAKKMQKTMRSLRRFRFVIMEEDTRLIPFLACIYIMSRQVLWKRFLQKIFM